MEQGRPHRSRSASSAVGILGVQTRPDGAATGGALLLINERRRMGSQSTTDFITELM